MIETGIPPGGVLADPATEGAIAALIEPGLRDNAWRPDFDEFRRRRLWNECFHQRRVQRLRQLWPTPRATVLDLGSGRGGMAVALARVGYQVVALDMRQRCTRLARLRSRRYQVPVAAVRARGEQLPFADASFDAVVCRDVLEHCEEPRRLLQEIRRVLRVGGSCFITVINRWCWVDPHYHLFGLAFLPRALAERRIERAGRTKGLSRDRQRFSDLHYYSYGAFHRLTAELGFTTRDLIDEQIRDHRSTGLPNRLAWLVQQALRPLSLQSNHFELLLGKAAPTATSPVSDT